MKNHLYIILGTLALALMSCDRSERIFDEPVADRIDNALQLYREALVGQRTWVMEYFPDSQLRYGGWVYVLQSRPYSESMV